MAPDREETDRVAVKTYVPTYQREIWDENAEELDMSRSEFVRSMVQAGRRGFDPGGDVPKTPEDEDTRSTTGGDSTVASDAGAVSADPDSFDALVLDLLDDQCLSWDDLLDALTEDIEDRLDSSIQRLQEANEIQHSGRDGGYVRLE